MTTTFQPGTPSNLRAASEAMLELGRLTPQWVGADRSSAAVVATKPLLRGRLHQLCAATSVPAGLSLVSTSTPDQRPAAVAFTLTWTAMFTTSACYHRLARSESAVRRLRRADHSMIFVHMGGSATALSLLCLPVVLAASVLAMVWLTVLGGVVVKLTRLNHEGSAGSWLYGVLGLAVAATTPMHAAALSPGQLTLLVASGLFYAVGAILFFGKRLDLAPTVFGYHEVWHCFTLAGSSCFYVLLTILLG